MKHVTIFSVIFLFIFSSCKKDNTVSYNSSVKAPISIEFDNIVGSADLLLDNQTYTNANNEQFSISMFKYFISNIVLTKTDGSKYPVPQDSSYFLIDESNTSSLSPRVNVPEGEYTSLEFVLGVDSLRNTMDISRRTGVLDPTGTASGMYWSWNSGYIFFKMEGSSPASTQVDNVFHYHIGLFGGYSTPTLNNLKKVTINLSSRGVAKVKSGKVANVHLLVDAMKMFNGSTNISIATNAVVMASPFSAQVANNYANMFEHDHTEN
ncbi:MAG: MbnP family protein [bacterium]|jgi:hypothetical protein